VTGQCPQEGPQLVAAQLPQPAPPAVVLPTLPAKVDISRFARFEPHFGQTMSTFSSRLRKNTSKFSLHLPHLNSKIGIGSIPPAGHKIPRSLAADGNPLSFSGFGRVEETSENVKDDKAGRSEQTVDWK
jgi:hypothetical protein